MNLKLIAQALRSYFSQTGRTNVLSDPGSSIFTATLSSDFIRGAGTRVLDRLVEEYSRNRDSTGDTIIAYCLIELKGRGVKLDHVTYDALKGAFPDESLMMQVPGIGNVELAAMNPSGPKLSNVTASARKTIGGSMSRR